MKNFNETIERIKSLFTEERMFGNLVVEEKLDLIKKHNVLCDKKKETYPTTLDNANVIIIQMILDNFSLNRFESSVT